jgi:hypothetical protein
VNGISSNFDLAGLRQRGGRGTNAAKEAEFRPPGDLTMKAVIVCDSFAFAAKATAALRRVGFGAGVNVRWAVKCWPVNALSQSEVVKTTLGESSDVHLILFSTHSARRFPLFLRDWLERWAALREVPDAALGVIRAADDSELAEPACSELRQFAEEHGLNFIMGEDLSTFPSNLPKLRACPKSLMPEAPRKRLPKRFFVPVHSFEGLDFPVQVRQFTFSRMKPRWSHGRLMTYGKSVENGMN